MNTKSNKAVAVLKVFLFCAVLLTGLIGSIASEKEDVSFYENRTLAVFPLFNVSDLLDRSYFDSVETYISDHFVFRETLLQWNIQKEMALHAPVINGTVLTSDVLLPYISGCVPTYDAAQMQEEVAGLLELDTYCKENGIAFLFVGVPEQRTAMGSCYPDYLLKSSYENNTVAEDFFRNLQENGVDYLNMDEFFSADYAPFYSKTDHHYNLYGAYETYLRTMEYVNENYFSAPVLTNIQIEAIDRKFLGSHNRKIFGLYASDDQLYTYRSEEVIPFERYDNGHQVESAVFNENLNNFYSYYMGGDYAETIIRTNRPELKNALIMGESFTNALETLLYRSFNETRSLDFRHYTEKSIYEYLEEYKPDVFFLVRDDLSYIDTSGNGNLSHTPAAP